MVDVRRLIWDPGNVAHIARHGVAPRDVVDICESEHVTLKSYLGREIVIGPTREGRLVTAVLEALPGLNTYYVVSARPASRKERRYYQDWQEGNST